MFKQTKKTVFILVATAVLGLASFVAWHYVGQGQPTTAAADRMLWPETVRRVSSLETAALERNDAATLSQLGYAYIQQARETGDGVATDNAEAAFHRALEVDPQSYEALTGLGTVYLSRHRFAEAVKWGQQAQAIKPHAAAAYGVLVDGYLELGQYDEAVAAAQEMVDRRPDLSSYSRVAYVRELMGDLPGAVDAMQRAVSAASGSLEHTNWSRVQLGNLYAKQGQLHEAERAYRLALHQLPYYGPALAGMARLKLAQGQAAEAVLLAAEALEVLPIPEHTILLAEAHAAAGQAEQATARFDEAVAILEEEGAGGMDVDDELARLLLDLGRDAPRALALAEGLYKRRPTLYAADILAQAYVANGRAQEAVRLSREALRFKTADPALYHHAGQVAEAVGDRAGAVRAYEKALALNPHYADREAVQRRLTELGRK